MLVSRITPKLHYAGKILKQGNKFYNGIIQKTLKSGNNVGLEYKNGLIQKAVIGNKTGFSTKIYEYDHLKNLVNVVKNGKNIFSKQIKNHIGIDFWQTEVINNNIYKFFDSEHKLFTSKILPRGIISNFSYLHHTELNKDLVREDRFFIPNLIRGRDGNFYIKGDKDTPPEPYYEWYKTIFKIPALKHFFVIEKNNNKINGYLRDTNGEVLGELNTYLDKNSRPIWEQITSDKGFNVDLKSFYSDDGQKEREMIIQNMKYARVANDKTLDEFGNAVYERVTRFDSKSNADIVSVYERKFNDRNLPIEEKLYRETESGKVLVFTVKKEYNEHNLPVKTEYYNDKNELELSEYNIYDKNGKLRVAGYHNYSENCESGYDVYDGNGNLRKRAFLFDEESLEEFYDKNGFYTKLLYKDDKGIVKFKYNYLYDSACKKIKTLKKDRNNDILYSIEHKYKSQDDSVKEVMIYRDAQGKFVGKQFIYSKDDDFRYYYTDENGKRCTMQKLAAILGEDDI